MASALDLRMPGVAQRLVTKYGVQVILRRNTGTYVPSTGKMNAATAETTPLLITPPSPIEHEYWEADIVARAKVQFFAAKLQTLPRAFDPDLGYSIIYDTSPDRPSLIAGIKEIRSGVNIVGWVIAVEF